jgi:hypothetical protein
MSQTHCYNLKANLKAFLLESAKLDEVRNSRTIYFINSLLKFREGSAEDSFIYFSTKLLSFLNADKFKTFLEVNNLSLYKKRERVEIG